MKYGFIFALCILFSLNAVAQRHSENSKGFEFSGGFMDNTKFPPGDNGAFALNLSYSSYISTKSYYKTGLDMSEKSYTVEGDLTAPIMTYLVDGKYFYSILSNSQKSFFVNIGGGGFLGFENVNKLKREYTSRYYSTGLKNRFVYGLNAGIEIEYFFTSRFGIVASLSESKVFNSNLSSWHSYAQVGFKYLIF
ncbi:MAG: conjugal transfer protein TraO [Bacteroidales bacterium]|jgi:hypothetical protein|nr:conjugal transfer protein TraO [Bacteroidales bacterium]